MKKIRILDRMGQYQGGNWFQYILIGLFIMTAAFFVYIYIIGHFRADVLYTKTGLGEEMMSYRFYYSQGCFAYYDTEIMRPYPFVIDAKKFTEESLERCMQSPFAYNLTLYREGYAKSIHTGNWEGKFTSSYSKKVLIYDDMLHNGTLLIQADYSTDYLEENKVEVKSG